jgi:hypothetical protein
MTNGVVNVNVRTGNSLKVDSDNNLYLDTVGLFNNITFDRASTVNYGVVKIKDTNSGLDVTNGIISTKIATTSNLGAVAVGDTLDIDSETGVLNVRDNVNKNFVINGSFNIWQRGTNFVGVSAATYTADRWTTTSIDSGLTENVSRQILSDSDLPSVEAGCSYFLRMNHTPVGNTKIAIAQYIELNVAGKAAPFRVGTDYTLSFYARSSVDGTALGASLEYRDNSYTTDPTNRKSVNSKVVNLTTDWVRYQTTGTMLSPSATNTGLAVFLESAPTIAENVNIDIAAVQLEQGRLATPFEYRHISTELDLCQRYFYKITGQWPMCIRGFNGAEANNYVGVNVVFPNVMRRVPIMSGDGYAYGSTTGSAIYADHVWIAATSNDSNNTCSLTSAQFDAEL